MSDLLPENTNVSRSKQVPRSLISAPQDEKEQNQWLPLAPMIRHWFDKWITEGKQSSSSQVSTNKEHGNKPRTLGSFPTPYQSRSNHYYQCLSDDFSLKRPTLSSNIEKELKGKKIPDISFGVSMARALENQCRISISAASTKEWLLATLGRLIREIISHLNDGTATATDCSDALSTCLDLLDSAGKASETQVAGLTYVTYALTLARRDALLKVVGNLSDDLQSELRHAPIIWKEHGKPDNADDKPQFLFRGVCEKIRADREAANQTNMQNLVLLATNKAQKPPAGATKRKTMSSYAIPKNVKHFKYDDNKLSNQPFHVSDNTKTRGRGTNRGSGSSRGITRGN